MKQEVQPKKKYYKVVRVDKAGRLISVYSNHLEMSLWVTYSHDKWAVAPAGGLLVFENLRAAKRMTSSGSYNLKIYRCDVEEPVELPGCRLSTNQRDILLQEVEDFWKYAYFTGSLWPKSTKAFRKVRLKGQPL